MSKQEKTEMDKIIKNTLNLDSEKVVEKLQEKFPDVKFDVNTYSQSFMEAIEEEINSGKTIQKTGGTSNISAIRNVIRENYTHNSLLNEIKNKPSMKSIIKEKSFDNTSN